MSTKTVSSEQNILNGVNVSQLGETIHEVRKDPDIAHFIPKVRNQWHGGALNKARVKDYYIAKENMQHKDTFEIQHDEPPILLGEDRGANPVEVLLAALSGCMTTTLAVYSAAENRKLDSVESEYEGDIDLQGFLGIDDGAHSGYNEIRVKFKVRGDATEEEIHEMVKNSPVYDTLRRPIQIRIDVEKE